MFDQRYIQECNAKKGSVGTHREKQTSASTVGAKQCGDALPLR